MPNDACETSWLTTPPPRADRGIGGTGEHTDDLAAARGVVVCFMACLVLWGVACVAVWLL